MAKKPTTVQSADVNEIPPAMDYAMHNATYQGFAQLLKWSIIALAVICVALYFFIEGHNPILGGLLLLAIPVGAVVLVITGSRR